MNINYEKKYRKYKLKYSQLKNNLVIQGGAEDEKIIIDNENKKVIKEDEIKEEIKEDEIKEDELKEVKNKEEQYKFENFGFIQLDPSNKKVILENELFNFNKELKLIDLISKLFIPRPDDGEPQITMDYDIIIKIKNILFEITKIDDILIMDNNAFMEHIFGDLMDRENNIKQYEFYTGAIKYNIYGFDKFRTIDDKEKLWGYSNRKMFLNCILTKNLSADSYIFYYMDNNYKMVMMVNKSEWGVTEGKFTISEHIFIHKLPSTILIEKLFGQQYFDMASKLHKYAIQVLKPTYIVSAPLEIMIPVFNKLCEEKILLYQNMNNMIEQEQHKFCYKPTKIYAVIKNNDLI